MPSVRSLFALAAIALAGAPAPAQDQSIIVASTTSTQDSGLFAHILPLFKAKTGIDVMTDVAKGLQAIKAKQAPFISRGDRSGTHIAELDLWKAAGVDIGKDRGPWYKEIGQGMGAALNVASATGAYVLADRGTWLAFKNRGDLDILVAGD